MRKKRSEEKVTAPRKMSAKFMAFENEPSTSNPFRDSDNANGERIEMNTHRYPNYQSSGEQQLQFGIEDVATTEASSASPYGVVDENADEDDMTDDMVEKESRKNVGYRKFIANNCEQFKSIFGGEFSLQFTASVVVHFIWIYFFIFLLLRNEQGLILLLGSGIHIVWGIYRVFNLYHGKDKQMHSMASRCIIWSWYLGAIAGSIVAGYALQSIRKQIIYVRREFTSFVCFALLKNSYFTFLFRCSWSPLHVWPWALSWWCWPMTNTTSLCFCRVSAVAFVTA